jgi:hypothetical protein
MLPTSENPEYKASYITETVTSKKKSTKGVKIYGKIPID